MTGGAAATSFTSSDSLTLLLTAESLLFAAFGIVVLIVRIAPGGTNVEPNIAWIIAGVLGVVIAAVAAGALLAWWQVFVDAWPSGGMARIEAGAAAAGICVQPFVVAALVWAIKP